MGGRVLIVDDSPEIIDILQDILPRNMKKQVALNGSNALKLLKSSNDLPDLILLDIMMPGIDGFEVCRRIKRINRFREIPIIFISSLDQSFDKVKAFNIGAVDYITKPFKREEVLARINTHLELYQSRKVIRELYSETIQGTIGAMNDMLALANPEISNFSNSLKLYSEKIMDELRLSNVWDLRLACVFSGLGMLSENMKKETAIQVNDTKQSKENIELEIEKVYESLALSNDIINRIPRFEAVTQILEKAMHPLEQEDQRTSLEQMESEVLKGHILRVLISYLYQYEREKNYIQIIETMQESEAEVYSPELLDILAKVQSRLIDNEILTVSISELRAQMILVENLYCPNGRLILKSGSELSQQMIMLIRNFGMLANAEIDVMVN